MAENGNKKRRIARIGLPSGEDKNLHYGDGLVQTDCNIVYDIMQQMNKSQNVMSYQQYQESRSKEKLSRTNNSDHNSSSKQNGKILSSKQLKKFLPEKSHSLMAKCRKSMQYLQKNRCMPKPRAHVGFIPRPTQNPIPNFQTPTMDSNHSVSSNMITHKASSMRGKQNSETSVCSPKLNEKLKKSKTNSVNKSCDINASQTQSVQREPTFVSDADTDSDNDFEAFLKKHHPEKFVRRKTDKKKIKSKKRKEFICAKRIAKFTSKTLPESEESAGSEAEFNALSESARKMSKVDEEQPSKRFQRIVEYENSEDSTDFLVNGFGSLDYDSSSSSENEKTVSKTLKENKEESIRIEALQSFDVTSSASQSAIKDTLCDDVIKLKCKIPCFVVIKRDPILDRKAASLQTDSSVTTNLASASLDEDDCIIIDESPIDNFSVQNSENITPFLGKGNSNCGESNSLSAWVSEESTNTNDVQNKCIRNEEHIFRTNNLELQTETNSNLSSAEILLADKIKPLEMQENEKVSIIAAASRKTLCNTEEDGFNVRNSSKNVDSIECENENASSVNSRHTSDIPYNETNIPLVTSAVEQNMFNVQILSVKSLNESDVIVLSDDNEEGDTQPVPSMKKSAAEEKDSEPVPTMMESAAEEKDTEPVPTMNETKESGADDSDVEIICLDSSINKDKSINEKGGGVINNDIHDVAKNFSSSSARPLDSVEDDCIILDELPSEDICSAKDGDKVKQTSQVVNNEKSISCNVPDSDKDSILKILGTIDFNCINKVLKDTAVADTRASSIPAKAESFLCDIETSQRVPSSFPEKLNHSNNGANLPRIQASLESSVVPIEVNIKKSSLDTTLVDTRGKHPKLPLNSIVHDIKSGSENVSSSINLDRTPSSCDINLSSPVSAISNINLAAPKSFAPEKGNMASCSIPEANAMLHSRKNQQLPPVNTKVESFESPSDELDIIAAKSIRNMDEKEKDSIVPLLELYRAEYKRFMGMKRTEQHVSEGLKLLREKQAKKLLAISSSIKNIVKKDACFHKINNEFSSNHNEGKSVIKSDSVEKVASLDQIKNPLESATRPSVSSYCDLERDDKVKIFNQSVVERASAVLNSAGSSSSQEVYNHLINSVCAECGKHAVAACLGCANIYYCSEKCGMSYWSKGHFATCRR